MTPWTPVELVDGDVLCCPRCGEENLHQCRIEAFNRECEDAPSVAVTIDQHNGSRLPRLGVTGENPSSRRQGLLIYFECEQCDAKPALAVAQHKGATLIGWVATCSK